MNELKGDILMKFELDERFTEVTLDEMMDVDGGKFNWKALICPVVAITSTVKSAKKRAQECKQVMKDMKEQGAIGTAAGAAACAANMLLGTAIGTIFTGYRMN